VVKSVRVSGGGANSPFWKQLLADILNKRVVTLNTSEGSAYGAALLGGVAGGMFNDVPDAVARCVRVHTTVEPDPVWQSAYEDIYARFGALYPALDTVKENTA